MVEFCLMADYYSADVCLCAQVSLRDLPPPYASHGDVLITLDCGSQLTAHSAFLAHASSILAEAIALAPQPAAGQKLHLPLESVSLAQATLLLQVGARPAAHADVQVMVMDDQVALQMVYDHRWDVWSLQQSTEDLQELASVAHMLDSQHLLTLCDETFVLKCGKQSARTCLTPLNVASLYKLASDLHLPGAACCMHAHWPCLPAIA